LKTTAIEEYRISPQLDQSGRRKGRKILSQKEVMNYEARAQSRTLVKCHKQENMAE
jgi:hypothetical protein